MVKPEFWDDEKLASISRDARLAFIGMWNNSDDYAVIKGHPAWLKNKIFPYDDIKLSQFQAWLLELETIKVILPFECNGEKYYYIKNFLKHQTINRPSPAKNPQPPESLIEDSLNNHGGLTVDIDIETETETETETTAPSEPSCPDAQIIELYHRMLPGLPRVKIWTDSRKKTLASRWKEDADRQSLAWWEDYFGIVSKSPFLLGKADTRNGEKPFRADLEWLINKANMVKTIEGRYLENKPQATW
jgi:hypothetical protein